MYIGLQISYIFMILLTQTKLPNVVLLACIFCAACTPYVQQVLSIFINILRTLMMINWIHSIASFCWWYLAQVENETFFLLATILGVILDLRSWFVRHPDLKVYNPLRGILNILSKKSCLILCSETPYVDDKISWTVSALCFYIRLFELRKACNIEHPSLIHPWKATDPFYKFSMRNIPTC